MTNRLNILGHLSRKNKHLARGLNQCPLDYKSDTLPFELTMWTICTQQCEKILNRVTLIELLKCLYYILTKLD